MTNVIQLPHKSAKNDNKQKSNPLFEHAHLLRHHIVRPSLGIVDAHSRAMENLIIGAALDNNEVLLGMKLCNIDKRSYARAIDSVNRTNIKDFILSACYMDIFPQHEALSWNARLACLVSLIIFDRAPNPPPLFSSPQELYRHYKAHFPSLSDSAPHEALACFNAAVETM